MTNNHILENINKPSDVKKLKESDLPLLAEDIRSVLIDTVSKTGGHLASNLGVVELTIALHRVFNSPHDKIIWDVGHQVYAHKLLTGRYNDFSTLRQPGGISGFSAPCESEHDIFYSGHSSTSISAAYGIAQANKLKGNKDYTVAVIGDGAFTGGMAFEALNNAGRERSRLIVILNDNDMSISKNVGSFAKHLAVIKARPSYFKMKAKAERTINKIPVIGVKLSNFIFKIKTGIKKIFYKSSTLFEDFGFRYMGPIDGHNIDVLIDALEGAKSTDFPMLLHIKTVKGKGYDFAEHDPSVFHGVPEFDINTGELKTGGKSFSSEFGDILCHFAENDKRICAVTAAMSLGTGLESFKEKFPERFFDVGIAEEHAVTFCSGLSKGGMIPVFAVYSAFLQRSYDQIVHDAALQKLKIILAIDRAGFVTGDGETHHGLLDVPFLNTIPGVIIYSPSTYEELSGDFFKAIYKENNTVIAIRFFKGEEAKLPEDFILSGGDFDIYGREDAKTALVTYGRLASSAAKAVGVLKEKGVLVKLVKLNKIKPINLEAVKSVLNCDNVIFYEECEMTGGAGESFNQALSSDDYKGRFFLKAVEDKFVNHSTAKLLLEEYGFDTRSMVDFILGTTKDDQ